MQSGSLSGLSLPRLWRAQLKWKVSGAGFLWSTGHSLWFLPKGERHPPRPRSRLVTRPGSLPKISQSARDVQTTHSQQREEFWAGPTAFLYDSSQRPPSLCSSLRMPSDTAWPVLQHARNFCWGVAETSPKVRFQQISLLFTLLVIFYCNVHVCSSLFPFKATFQHLRPGKVHKFSYRSWDQAINELVQNKQHARQESNTYSLQWRQVKGQMSHSVQKCLCYETCDLNPSLKQHLCHAPVAQHHLCLLITQNKLTNTIQR